MAHNPLTPALVNLWSVLVLGVHMVYIETCSQNPHTNLKSLNITFLFILNVLAHSACLCLSDGIKGVYHILDEGAMTEINHGIMYFYDPVLFFSRLSCDLGLGIQF